MPDPRHRLYRPVLGERRHALPELVDRVMGWDVERCTRAVEAAEHKEPRDVKVRDNRRLREPTAYAPKLIRLVRHPYALDKARFERRDAAERARPEARERVSFTEAFAAARQAERRQPFPKPTDVHPPLVVRARPSADAWLAGAAPAEGER